MRQEVPIVVAGNKVDLATMRREVPIEDVSEWLFCELPKLRAKVMECSAKDDYNVKDIFRCFVTLSKIVPKNHVGESDESALRRRCSAYGSRRYSLFFPSPLSFSSFLTFSHFSFSHYLTFLLRYFICSACRLTLQHTYRFLLVTRDFPTNYKQQISKNVICYATCPYSIIRVST